MKIRLFLKTCADVWSFRIRCGLASGYLSNIFNGQCTMSSLLAQSSFGLGLLLACISGTEQVQTLIPQLRPENFVRVPHLSFLYNLGEPIWKVLYSWDFQSPSYALQSVLQLSAIPPRTFPARAK